MKNTTLRNALVTLGSFIFVVTIVGAWTAPTGAPPTNNVSAPITVSNVWQKKAGPMGVTALVSDTIIQVGPAPTVNCSAPFAGSIRFNNDLKCIEYCNETSWVCMAVQQPVVMTHPSCLGTWNTPGAHTCQIPLGKSSVSITVAGGGGAAGGLGTYFGQCGYGTNPNTKGGSGGYLSTTTVPVTPGQQFTIHVGGGGIGTSDYYASAGSGGGSSAFGSSYVAGGGGSGGGGVSACGYAPSAGGGGGGGITDGVPASPAVLGYGKGGAIQSGTIGGAGGQTYGGKGGNQWQNGSSGTATGNATPGGGAAGGVNPGSSGSNGYVIVQ